MGISKRRASHVLGQPRSTQRHVRKITDDWKNGYVESSIGKLRDELLNGEVLATLAEAKVLVEGWRKEYNHFMPRRSLGYGLPAPEAYEVGKFTQGLAH